MAKNYQTGRIYHNWTKKESRIVEKIDRKDKRGEYNKEFAPAKKISENATGTCWSF